MIRKQVKLVGGGLVIPLSAPVFPLPFILQVGPNSGKLLDSRTLDPGTSASTAFQMITHAPGFSSTRFGKQSDQLLELQNF